MSIKGVVRLGKTSCRCFRQRIASQTIRLSPYKPQCKPVSPIDTVQCLPLIDANIAVVLISTPRCPCRLFFRCAFRELGGFVDRSVQVKRWNVQDRTVKSGRFYGSPSSSCVLIFTVGTVLWMVHGFRWSASLHSSKRHRARSTRLANTQLVSQRIGAL